MLGLLTIPWTMTAELFPTEIRGIGHSLSYSMANILMFAAIQSYRLVSIGFADDSDVSKNCLGSFEVTRVEKIFVSTQRVENLGPLR